MGEQIQACMALVGSLESGDRRSTTQKEKEEKGDMGLGKSIVLGMDKFSCKIGQDPSAHASEVVQVVNTLSLSDVEKKTAFLATLQGYPLRMMSGMAGNPLVTFAELVAEFLGSMAETTGVLKMRLIVRRERTGRRRRSPRQFSETGSMPWLWQLEKTSTSQQLSVCFWMA